MRAPDPRARSTPLILPVEHQARELDAKLLLACVAAQRGYPVVIGARREVEMDMDRYRRGILLSKDLTIRSLLPLFAARSLGHDIVSWDEEALVHLPDAIYDARRLNARVARYPRHLFAWGEDNAELWRRCPSVPRSAPIHVTGNPRSDLLRSDLRRYYERDAEELRKEHGDFVLVNTNFNHVNAFFPQLNLFHRGRFSGRLRPGRGTRRLPRDFALALHAQKLALFEAFQQMIPALARAFPELRVIVRPHPTEKHDAYAAIAAQLPNVRVTSRGNVVPWLLACRAVIHNGCTTGVEAFALGVPSLSYRPRVEPRIDDTFYRLPHTLSRQCFTLDALRESVDALLAPGGSADRPAGAGALLEHAVTGLAGRTASERIVDVLDAMPAPAARSARLLAPVARLVLGFLRRYRGALLGEQHSPEFQRHRYPGVELHELRERVARWQALLGARAPLHVEPLADHVFRISSAR
jgi:surface carbohydrate biosynthesis protein